MKVTSQIEFRGGPLDGEVWYVGRELGQDFCIVVGGVKYEREGFDLESSIDPSKVFVALTAVES